MALIDKDKTTRAVTYWSKHYDPSKPRFDKRNIEDVIRDQPIVEAVPMTLCEQIQFERDVALSQLKQLNIGLGEKPYLKAIPIEWIKQWDDKCQNGKLSYWLCDDYEWHEAIVAMLADWKEENENG